jgi:hypothetical protein
VPETRAVAWAPQISIVPQAAADVAPAAPKLPGAHGVPSTAVAPGAAA